MDRRWENSESEVTNSPIRSEVRHKKRDENEIDK
jgi:hypothetical protein